MTDIATLVLKTTTEPSDLMKIALFSLGGLLLPSRSFMPAPTWLPLSWPCPKTRVARREP